MKDQLSPYLPALLQITHGLDGCGLLEIIRRSPEVWQHVFTAGNVFKITADDFLCQLVVEYSASQIKKLAEMDTYKFFCDVIELMDTGQ